MLLARKVRNVLKNPRIVLADLVLMEINAWKVRRLILELFTQHVRLRKPIPRSNKDYHQPRPFIFIIFLIFSTFSHEKTGTRRFGGGTEEGRKRNIEA